MKTAEEWVTTENTKLTPRWPNEKKLVWSLSSYTWSHEAEHSEEGLVEFVKQIQLDAWKQGMSDAAEIAQEIEYPSDAILCAKEQKQTL